MYDSKLQWKMAVARAIVTYLGTKGIESQTVTADSVVLETPPRPDLGDYGFPMFPYAKIGRSAPAAIAQAVASFVATDAAVSDLGKAVAEGPYLNVRLNRTRFIDETLSRSRSSDWGKSIGFVGKRVMVEFSCPNTNKPLHLGHLRNNILGESVARILKAAGADVRKVNLINDRGVHICKSMLAYMQYGGGRTPEDEGLKTDHFVGKYYVLFNTLKEENPESETQAQELLRRWEAGDTEVINLWRRMNGWAVEGIKKTYERQGISFDSYYFESDTYMRGRDEVLKGLSSGTFYKEEDGSVWVNLEDIGLDKKVLLRRDGTSLYITQDIGTAIYRHTDWPFDRLVYVVASEQQYHFKVLFEILKRLGFSWAQQLYHLSYGLVNLPTGRMKTREGTVVDADDLMDELTSLAAAEIESKGRENSIDESGAISISIALGALHYYLLQISPVKDMLYDPEQSLSFTGDTGPYIQYMGARASSILRKHAAGEGNAVNAVYSAQSLASDADWCLVRLISLLPETIDAAASAYDPSIMANYIHDLAAGFSSWYRENPVLSNPDAGVAASRVELVRAVAATFKIGCSLLGIPFLTTM